MNIAKQIVTGVERLPAFPRVAQRVLELTSGGAEVELDELADVIQCDSALTANLLRLCNSAWYGFRTQIHSVREAVARLGIDTVRDMVIMEASASYLSGSYSGYALQRGYLWQHSLCTALMSRILAHRLGLSHAGRLYTAALLHDIGKTVLNEHVREAWIEIFKLVDQRGCELVAAEREVLGTDHCEVGACIAERWGLPAAIVTAIAYHHRPEATPGDKGLIGLLYLSNILCLQVGIGVGAAGLACRERPELADELGLSRMDVHQAVAQLMIEYDRIECLLDPGVFFGWGKA